jgi:putative ABC transport system ATP-binding protein
MELLDAVGLAGKAHQDVASLSMGQAQRVALARALATDPELILADEPTASLDAQTGLSAMHLLRGLTKERGKTVLVVSHDPRIFHLADRILRLDDGLLLGEETATLPTRSADVVT